MRPAVLALIPLGVLLLLGFAMLRYPKYWAGADRFSWHPPTPGEMRSIRKLAVGTMIVAAIACLALLVLMVTGLV